MAQEAETCFSHVENHTRMAGANKIFVGPLHAHSRVEDRCAIEVTGAKVTPFECANGKTAQIVDFTSARFKVTGKGKGDNTYEALHEAVWSAERAVGYWKDA